VGATLYSISPGDYIDLASNTILRPIVNKSQRGVPLGRSPPSDQRSDLESIY
jgi:hypothetical protein